MKRKLNSEHINDLIQTIKNERNFFNMSSFTAIDARTQCQTPACIGGWVQFKAKKDDKQLSDHPENTTALWLGLSYDAAYRLCFPSLSDRLHAHIDYDVITRAEAIKALEHLRDTGEVSWDFLAEDGSPSVRLD